MKSIRSVLHFKNPEFKHQLTGHATRLMLANNKRLQFGGNLRLIQLLVAQKLVIFGKLKF